VYLRRLRAGIAAMAAAIGGLDVLAFTGGVGENAPAIRAGAVEGLEFLGLTIEPARNEAGSGDRAVGQPAGPVAVLVIRAREDLEMAANVRSVLPALARGSRGTVRRSLPRRAP
jgi:acetate kinase